MAAHESLGPQFSDLPGLSMRCGTYAEALYKHRPDLRLGAAGKTYNDHYDDDPEGKNFQPSHFFSHDDTHAYDEYGTHKLPYHGPSNLRWEPRYSRY